MMDSDALSGIDRTMPENEIEVAGVKRVGPVMMEPMAGALLTVPGGGEAARLRDGLRGSVIEADLQSLFEKDGVGYLTGHGQSDEALTALEYAGLPTDLLATIRGWDADEIAVSLVDARYVPEHRLVIGRTGDGMSMPRPIITKKLLQRLGCETIEDSEKRGGFDKARGDYDFGLSRDMWDAMTFAFRQLFHADFARRIAASFVLDTCWYEDLVQLAEAPEVKAALSPQAEANLAVLRERLAELGPA